MGSWIMAPLESWYVQRKHLIEVCRNGSVTGAPQNWTCGSVWHQSLESPFPLVIESFNWACLASSTGLRVRFKQYLNIWGMWLGRMAHAYGKDLLSYSLFSEVFLFYLWSSHFLQCGTYLYYGTPRRTLGPTWKLETTASKRGHGEDRFSSQSAQI